MCIWCVWSFTFDVMQFRWITLDLLLHDFSPKETKTRLFSEHISHKSWETKNLQVTKRTIILLCIISIHVTGNINVAKTISPLLLLNRHHHHHKLMAIIKQAWPKSSNIGSSRKLVKEEADGWKRRLLSLAALKTVAREMRWKKCSLLVKKTKRKT